MQTANQDIPVEVCFSGWEIIGTRRHMVIKLLATGLYKDVYGNCFGKKVESKNQGWLQFVSSGLFTIPSVLFYLIHALNFYQCGAENAILSRISLKSFAS
jgi:hypothetical protein